MKLNFHFNKPHFLTKKKEKKDGKVKNFLSQFSRGLMLPIAILPVAGLLLGIGGVLGANLKGDATAVVFSNIFKGMGDVVFAVLPILFCVAITITFSKDKGSAAFSSMLAYFVFCSIQLAFFQYDEAGNLISIMWFHTDKQIINSITTTTLGFRTLQTSIFGGIVVGLLTSYLYNHISKWKLPTALDFFSGIRLVPIILIPAISLLAVVFLIIWPYIGYAINFLGTQIQKAPYGTGGLLYGILGRSLMPFGLHHIPIVLVFQTEIGGVLNLSELQTALINNGYDATSTVYKDIVAAFQKVNTSNIYGDQNIWNFISGLSYNTLFDTALNKEIPIFEWFNKNLSVYAGRYTQDYPTYLGVVIGIGVAMIVCCKKENRKVVIPMIASGMGVSFLTGITEPIEFTFLFTAPWLYYLAYVPLSGFSYMFMELLNAHVGTGFARGFIDLIVYGALQVQKGTNFYWAFPLAFGEGLLAFFLFWFGISKFNLNTPGRGNNDFNFNRQNKAVKQINKDDDLAIQIILALGGKDNIKNVTACATRLRISVNDINLVNKAIFKDLKSKGEIYSNNNIQLIYGGYATVLSTYINEILEDNTKEIKEQNKVEINNDVIKNKPLNVEPQQTNNEVVDIFDEQNDKPKEYIPFSIYAPFDGIVFYLKDVDDSVFQNKILGDGIAILPKSSHACSPIDKGQLIDVFDTKHCYIFQTEDGTKIMMHIGIDSIKLKQSPFDLKVNKNIDVTLDTNIVDLNIGLLEQAKSSVTPIVMPNLDPNRKIELVVRNRQIIKKGDILLKVI